MTIFGIIWLVLFLAVLGYEFYALGSKRPGDTLSEQVWGLLRHSRAACGAIVALLVWLLWHFVVEPRFFPSLALSVFTDDVLLAMAFSTLGWVIGPIPEAGKAVLRKRGR